MIKESVRESVSYQANLLGNYFFTGKTKTSICGFESDWKENENS